MRKSIYPILVLLFFSSSLPAVLARDAARPELTGEELFKTHCAVCHPEGGNIINPAKTLHKKDREANKITNVEDIIRQMRKPGPGMTPFDKTVVSDPDAKKLAEYILKKFP